MAELGIDKAGDCMGSVVVVERMDEAEQAAWQSTWAASCLA